MRQSEKQNQTLRDMEEDTLSYEQLRKIRGGTEDGSGSDTSDDADIKDTEEGGGASQANTTAILD